MLRATAEPTTTETHAFGMPLRTTFEIAGLGAEATAAGGEPQADRRETAAPSGEAAVRSAARPTLLEIERRLAARPDAEPLSVRRDADGRRVHSIERDADGFLLAAAGFGRFRVTADGMRVACDPVAGPAWRWQRYLLGQVLPFAAVLRGLEVLHASAVVGARGAIALTGPSGAGKTTLALELVKRGAGFLADDVVALDSSLTAHPAAAVASVRHDAANAIGGAGGAVLGDDGEALRLALARRAAPAPLRALYLLRRAAGPPVVERVDRVDPRVLLGAGFNFVLTEPERLTRQLDVLARLAREVEVHTASGSGAAELADRIAAQERLA